MRIFNPIDDTLRAQLRARAEDFTSYEPATIFVGTYNLNGKAPGDESLLPWLFPVEGASLRVALTLRRRADALTAVCTEQARTRRCS